MPIIDQSDVIVADRVVLAVIDDHRAIFNVDVDRARKAKNEKRASSEDASKKRAAAVIGELCFGAPMDIVSRCIFFLKINSADKEIACGGHPIISWSFYV